MKNIIVSALLAIVCLQPAIAQKQRPAQRQKATPEQFVKKMDKALQLNDKQEKQILAIYQDLYKERKSAKNVTREERKAMKADLNKKLSEVLTEEQMTKWKKIEKKQAKKRKAAQAQHNKKNKKNNQKNK